MDPDPVFKFLWIRIRFSNFSGYGSGFRISLDPDEVSAPGSRIPNIDPECQKWRSLVYKETSHRVFILFNLKVSKFLRSDVKKVLGGAHHNVAY